MITPTRYGYVVATISGILSSLDYNERMVNERLDSICSYLNNRDFPFSLAFRVRRYRQQSFFAARSTVCCTPCCTACCAACCAACCTAWCTAWCTACCAVWCVDCPLATNKTASLNARLGADCRYFKHYFDHKTGIDEAYILQQLSPQLRQEVSGFLLGELLWPSKLWPIKLWPIKLWPT